MLCTVKKSIFKKGIRIKLSFKDKCVQIDFVNDSNISSHICLKTKVISVDKDNCL